ncbi:MAG: phosphoenolpyruvate carboxykinase (ATP) [Halobacteriovoraceae bacterium]|nr:phosphoenolpyruvate carboxykinase (ATP) [Halobacteriovoraceae bacterium]
MKNFTESLGITSPEIFFNQDADFYIKETVDSGFGELSKDGALSVKTGKYTGRAAKDKYVVKSAKTEKTVWWENDVNVMTPEQFSRLKAKISNYLNEQEKIYTTEKCIGAHDEHNLGVRLVTTGPSHALFSMNMFRETVRDFDSSKDFTILHAPGLEVNPADFGTKSPTVITTCFDSNTVLICGTFYAGEIKKSVFSILNYILPERGVLPMHAGANKSDTETSVFFGLSGTGKTTLSTDEGRLLVGDDEHGLSDEGVFNFEGGCYAKTIALCQKNEPGIWAATNRHGAIVENVVLDPETKTFDFDDDSICENGRSSYPLSFIDSVEPSHAGGVPKDIFFLTADAFGVLPPVSRLSKEQALFYFVLGYTAKVAGTEAGVTEPTATFSACFGAPFMLRHPSEYAKLLGEYINRHGINVWLINTGWTAGPYGEGHRYPIPVTRNIIRSVQSGKMDETEFKVDEIFNLELPQHVDGIDDDVLHPHKSWKSQEDYQSKAKALAKSFHTQMEKFGDFYTSIKKAGPHVS